MVWLVKPSVSRTYTSRHLQKVRMKMCTAAEMKSKVLRAWIIWKELEQQKGP